MAIFRSDHFDLGFLRHRKFKLTLTAAVLIQLAAAVSANQPSTDQATSAQEDSEKVYVAGEAKKGFPDSSPKSSFDCTERIYAVMESDQVADGRHKFHVLFFDPDGKERERVEYDFIAQGDVRIWGWLRLHRGTGGTLMSVFDASAGMEDMIGDWTAKFHIDGEFLEEQTFEVLC